MSFRVAIVNPSAAGGRKQRKLRAIMARLSQENVRIQLTTGKGDAERIAASAAKEGAAEIVSVGGDGTHHEVLNGLFSKPKPHPILFPLTLGTGSDLQRTIGKTTLTADLFSLPVKKIDVGTVWTRGGKSFFINIADFGLGGEVVAGVNRTSKRWGGFLTFLAVTMHASVRYRPGTTRVYFDTGVEEGKFMNVIVANGKYFGAGMCIAPRASLEDGLFDLLLVKEAHPLRGVSILVKIYRGKHLLEPEIMYLRSKKVRALSYTTLLLDCDGEEKGSLPASFTVLPKALSLRAPWR